MAKAPVHPKELIIRAKFYRATSLIFVVLGLVIFMILYVGNIEGRLLDALKDPFTIGVFLIPFLPAAVLSWLADRNEKKYAKFLESKSQ